MNQGNSLKEGDLVWFIRPLSSNRRSTPYSSILYNIIVTNHGKSLDYPGIVLKLHISEGTADVLFGGDVVTTPLIFLLR